MSTSRKVILITVILILCGIAAWALLPVFHSQEKIKLKRGNVIESIYGLGTVTADQIYRVMTGTTLTIQKIFVTEGQCVQVGAPLVRLEDSTMRSPLAGTVTSVTAKDGELATPQIPIVTVTNLNRLYLEVSLEQQSVLRIKKDQPVVVSFESLRNEKYDGKVISIYPRDSQFIVRIGLSHWPSGVLPGMTADVAILVGKKENVLLIPLRAITAGHVVRIHNGKKERVSVQLGVIDGEWGEVLSPAFAESDEIILHPE